MEPDAVRARVRDLLLDDATLVRAIGTGRRRGFEARWRRLELRYVDLAAGRRLQWTAYDQTQAHVTNRTDVEDAVDEALAEPFTQWRIETTTQVHQVLIARKGEIRLTTTERSTPIAAERDHDRPKQRVLAPEDPVLRVLGISDDQGRVKPSRQAKYRQVEAFVRDLAAVVADARRAGVLREPTPQAPLRVVDLGCGNAYLTFAAHAWLAQQGPVRMLGVDVKEQARARNGEVARQLGLQDEVSFEVADIDDVHLAQPPDLVLALHACDTATDEALSRALEWEAPVVLAAPCCHHDVAAQLKESTPPEEYHALVRDGILRERLADTLTDAIRAMLLRRAGYRVDVVEFVPSRHTPRNTLLRAVRTGPRPEGDDQHLERLLAAWQITPRLQTLLESTFSTENVEGEADAG